MSNYPPGVTGNEPYLTGPTYSHEHSMTCGYEGCEFDGDVLVEGYTQTSEAWWTCPMCGYEHEGIELDDGPDPDLAYEMMREEQWDR
jgi:hypothetical protein